MNSLPLAVVSSAKWFAFHFIILGLRWGKPWQEGIELSTVRVYSVSVSSTWRRTQGIQTQWLIHGWIIDMVSVQIMKIAYNLLVHSWFCQAHKLQFIGYFKGLWLTLDVIKLLMNVMLIYLALLEWDFPSPSFFLTILCFLLQALLTPSVLHWSLVLPLSLIFWDFSFVRWLLW